MPTSLWLLLFGASALGLTAVVFWPTRGLWARWQKARHLTARVRREDALKHLYHCRAKNRRPTLTSLAGALHLPLNDTAELINSLQSNELVTLDGEDIQLTPRGQTVALHIIRAHRLWERYLADETGFDEAEWHGRAEEWEHSLTPEQANALASQLGYPTHDPHGDPIPTATGHMVSHGGQPLTKLSTGTAGRIVHIEDEPEIVYAQLVAENLHPGLPVHLIETTPERVHFWANGDEHILAPLLAANITVVAEAEAPVAEARPSTHRYLDQLPVGETAAVVGLSHRCRGAERRRFLDLGILPGTQITAEMRSPGGDPTAYIIRDALIALRQDQAHLIKIETPAPVTLNGGQ